MYFIHELSCVQGSCVDVLSVDLLQVFLVRFRNAFGWTTSVSCSLDEGQDHFLLFFLCQKLASTFDKNKKVKCEDILLFTFEPYKQRCRRKTLCLCMRILRIK
jgi:hypothetical protein